MAHDAESKKAKEGQMSKAAKMTEAHGQMLNTLLQMRGSGVLFASRKVFQSEFCLGDYSLHF